MNALAADRAGIANGWNSDSGRGFVTRIDNLITNINAQITVANANAQAWSDAATVSEWARNAIKALNDNLLGDVDKFVDDPANATKRNGGPGWNAWGYTGVEKPDTYTKPDKAKVLQQMTDNYAASARDILKQAAARYAEILPKVQPLVTPGHRDPMSPVMPPMPDPPKPNLPNLGDLPQLPQVPVVPPFVPPVPTPPHRPRNRRPR